jgi:DNA-binding MarR family transcriptional regulator
MHQFSIDKEGRISDSGALASISELSELIPDVDPSALESHMMLFRTHAAYFTVLSSMYEEMGITHSRFNMLRWLLQADGHRLTMSELGARLEASVPNVTRMVVALEAEGWVRKYPSEADRRAVFAELTPEGMHLITALIPKANSVWKELQSGLTSDEQEILSHLLAKLRMSLFSRYLGKDLIAFRLAAQRGRKSKVAGVPPIGPAK